MELPGSCKAAETSGTPSSFVISQQVVRGCTWLLKRKATGVPSKKQAAAILGSQLLFVEH